ncbi:UNVERIFIED_CONTAM: Kinesin-like protein KIN-10C, partial [Sesamum indicum]
MSEILSKARGLQKSVSVSLYELSHDQAYHLLNPKHPVVQVLEDAHGKINLKGLSQNPVFCQNSLSSIILVSRSCRSTRQVLTDFSSLAKAKVVSSLKSGKTISTSLSVKKQ